MCMNLRNERRQGEETCCDIMCMNLRKGRRGDRVRGYVMILCVCSLKDSVRVRRYVVTLLSFSILCVCSLKNSIRVRRYVVVLCV